MIAPNKMTDVPPVSRGNSGVSDTGIPAQPELPQIAAAAQADAADMYRTQHVPSRLRAMEKQGVRSTQSLHRSIAEHPMSVLVAAGVIGATVGWFVKRSRWMAG